MSVRAYLPEHFQEENDANDDENDTKTFHFLPQHMTQDDIPPETTHLTIDCSVVSKLGLYPKDKDQDIQEWTKSIQEDHNPSQPQIHQYQQQHFVYSPPSNFWGSCTRPYKWQSMLSSRKKTMEGHFFGQDVDLKAVQLISSNETSMIIIGPFAFCGCTFLRSVSVPPTLVQIGPCAFAQCRYLVDIQLSTGLQLIDDWAFFECESLRTMTIPWTVAKIGNHAFDSCDELVDLILERDTDGVSACLQEIQEYAFWKCHSLCAISLPASTYRLGKCAFADCVRLVGVELPWTSSSSNNENPLELGRSCFAGCYNLVNLCLATETKIESLAFAECPYKSQHFVNRFGTGRNVAVHKACYYASSLPKVHHLLRALVANSVNEDEEEEYDIYSMTDPLGMTPFHIVATSASLRLDILQVLLEEYSSYHNSWKLLAHTDNQDKSAMDYLLLNQSPRAIPLIQKILRHLIQFSMQQQWKGNRIKNQLLETIIEQMPWKRAKNVRKRRKLLDKILKTFVVHTHMESTSILEEALWKRAMMDSLLLGSNNNMDTANARQDCRVVCNANVVIPHVVEYLWDPNTANNHDDDEDEDDDSTCSDEDSSSLFLGDDDRPPDMKFNRRVPTIHYVTEELPPELSWLLGEVESDDEWDMW